MPITPRQIRSRTRSGRLQALDAYLLKYEAELLTGDSTMGDVVDVGFGEFPWTTLEMAEAFRKLNPDLHVIGVETDPRRIEGASPFEDEKTAFIEAGATLQAVLSTPARLVRAMNVLRGYREEEVEAAHRDWAAPLIEGGLLVEGTCDPTGAVLTAHLIRKRVDGLEREGLLLHTNFTRGFAPWMFRDWLPRDLRRRVQPGTPLHDFFTEWTRIWADLRTRGITDPARAFADSAHNLAAARPDVDGDPWLGEQGYLILRLT